MRLIHIQHIVHMSKSLYSTIRIKVVIVIWDFVMYTHFERALRSVINKLVSQTIENDFIFH